MRTKPTLELADAAPISRACAEAARDAGANVSIAIVDEAGVLLSFQRLDGAKAHTAELAIRKARTAAVLGVSTSQLEMMAREGRLQSAELIALAGGVPVIHAGQPCGGIGVSGSTSEIDERIAAAGLPKEADRVAS